MTMNIVHRLADETINKIAAGEVIERPASVVKELVENAIDSGASRIEVEIRNGGRQFIRVTDDGSGMEREDAILAIERHTTSKIMDSEDLWRIKTLGFRGEALPSIAAVSLFDVITKTENNDLGTQLIVKGGKLQKVKDVGAPNGTTIRVQDLFFNTPARLKYLKSIPTETSHISEMLSRLALGYPEISFKLLHHEYEVLFTPGNGDLYQTLVAVFGKEIAKEMLPLRHELGDVKISGYIGKPSIARTNRVYEIFFVNRRYFHCRTLSSAVEKAFHTLLPIARYPFVCLFVEIAPSLVDVNSHPTKMEVRFTNDSELFKTCYHGIRSVLKEHSLLAEWVAPEEDLTFSPKQKVPNQQPISNNLNLGFNEYAVTEPVAPQIFIQEEPAVTLGMYQSSQSTQPSATEEPKKFIADGFYIYPKTVQNTYLIVQDEKGLFFIDQHAAHERILYERYYKKANVFLGSQALLMPETVNLNYNQFRIASERLSLFGDLGFHLEAFGGKTMIIRAVPLSLLDYNYKQIIFDLIEQYSQFETFKSPAEIKEAFIITMACRTAIKAGDRLNPPELETLVRDLFRCENPYTCPHGRPTIFRMTVDELAKKFLRR